MVRGKNFCQWSILLVAAMASGREVQAATWWYEQAERLQLVSAALLDGPPIAEPAPLSPFVEFRMLTSLLPKVNPKVGAKSEKVPAAPFHAVPTLAGGLPLAKSGRGTLVGTAWGGLLPLPKSLAKTIGVNASMNQYILGMSGEYYFLLPKLTTYTSVGGQLGNATLSGSITSLDANDSFEAKMLMFYLAQGVQFRSTPLWANGMVIFRKGTSAFDIGAEKTKFTRDDTLADAQVPLAVQMTVGFSMLKRKLHLALSEYLVPNRLAMPRLSLVYQYQFGKNADSVSRSKSVMPAEPRRSRKNRNRGPRANLPGY
ncbi:hypothetical protein EBR21_11905 [bacterium]|nr:hypothetical protein [bacterium]